MAFLAFFSYTILFTFASEKFVKVSNISTGQNDSEEFIQKHENTKIKFFELTLLFWIFGFFVEEFRQVRNLNF
jgi:hypothetical protein